MVRLGMIGCGGIAVHHAKTIMNGVTGIEIGAAADVDPEALSRFGESFPTAALYENYGQMLKLADIDAVCVALPTHLHRRAVVDSAKAGRHIFCEKPMARTLRECDAMIDACAAAGVTLMIGQVRRYDTDWGTWKKIVENGTIGRPAVWRQTTGGSGPGRWYMDDAMGAGPFFDGCVHNWDFANYVFGKPAMAIGSLTRLSTTSALDTGTAIVRYEGGDEVMLNWSWGLPSGVSAGARTDILGPKGIVQFPGSFPEEHIPANVNTDTHGGYLVSLANRNRFVKFTKRDMFAAEWKDFRDSIVKSRDPLVTGEIGREAVEVALAAVKAGRTRKPVRIGGTR